MSDCVTFVSKLVECRCDGLPGKRWGGCLHDFHHILKYRQILAKIQILSLARLAELLVGLRFNSADSFCYEVSEPSLAVGFSIRKVTEGGQSQRL